MIYVELRLGIPFDGTNPHYQLEKAADVLRAMREIAEERVYGTLLLDKLEVIDASSRDGRQKLA